MATLKPLLALKSASLKALAVSIGTNSSGTKSELTSRIICACCEAVPFFERSQLEKEEPSRKNAPRNDQDWVTRGSQREKDKKKRKRRVLSIDVGIRNLAVCVLEVPGDGLSKTRSIRKKDVAENLPKVLAWERVAIAERPEDTVEKGPPRVLHEENVVPSEGTKSKSRPKKRKGVTETPRSEEQVIMGQEITPSEEAVPIGKSRSRKGKKITEAPPLPEGEEIQLGIPIIPSISDWDPILFPVSNPTFADKPPKKGGRATTKKKTTESFEPSVYSIIANAFVRNLLARFSPLDAVLIERQRYRSHSQAAILEWTVRVNMLEAMLHAVFRCLGEGPECVSPSKVTRFWIDKVGEGFLEVKTTPTKRRRKEALEVELGEELGVKGVAVLAKEGRTRNQTKLAKVALVKDWLQKGNVVSLGEGVEEVAAEFNPGKGKGKREPIGTGRVKLDDLADCLLQGMAWIQWENNRKNLAEGKLIPEFISCVGSKS